MIVLQTNVDLLKKIYDHHTQKERERERSDGDARGKAGDAEEINQTDFHRDPHPHS